MKNAMAIVVALYLLSGCAPIPAGAAEDLHIDAAVGQGVSYLRKVVGEDRHHLTCRASNGSSCPVHGTGHVFAAFFIASAIGDLLSPEERQKILARMDAEERQGVWGYMPYAPVDADDTAFVIRTYRMLGKEAATESLLRFYDKEAKAFTTFDGRGTADMVFEPSVAGNIGLHPEVNANIFTLLADTTLSSLINEELIGRAQTSPGWWRSYFYPGRYYATYMSLGLFGKTGKGETSRKKGIAFLHTSQNHDGSWGGAYDTSLALNALAACGVFDDAFRRGIAWLAAQQKPDGSWRDEDTLLWEYTYSDDPKIVWRAYDTDGVVTASLAIKALRSAREEKIAVSATGGGR
jgi:hypothetical protein